MALEPIGYGDNPKTEDNLTGRRPEPTPDEWERIKRHRAKRARELKKARRSRNIMIFLGLLIVIALVSMVVVFVCRIDTVEFEGNNIYSDEELEETLTAGKYCSNSVYFFLYYNYFGKSNIPFISDIRVKLEGLSKVKVTVEELEPVGRVKAKDDYVYFDRRGTVITVSDRELSEVPLVEGFSLSDYKKGEVLPVEDKNLLEGIITILVQSDNLDIPVSGVKVSDNGNISLFSGNIEVKLGANKKITEKMSLTKVLLNEIKGKSGILHMEDYDGSNGTRNFEER